MLRTRVARLTTIADRGYVASFGSAAACQAHARRTNTRNVGGCECAQSPPTVEEYKSDVSGSLLKHANAFATIASPLTGDKMMISTQGGTRPEWRGDGKKLSLTADRIMAVSIRAPGGIEYDAPQELFPVAALPDVESP